VPGMARGNHADAELEHRDWRIPKCLPTRKAPELVDSVVTATAGPEQTVRAHSRKITART
jgi:hypothetical protein